MSSVFWQTKRQNDQLKNGNSLTQRIEIFIKTWENRCYKDGIPDEIDDLLIKACRAPSYKSIALAILRNDHNLYSLGFSQRESKLVSSIVEIHKEKYKDNSQMGLFA